MRKMNIVLALLALTLAARVAVAQSVDQSSDAEAAARKEELKKDAALKRMAKLEKDIGKDGVLELDEDFKVIWAVERPRIVFEEIRRELVAYQEAQLKTLFKNKRDDYLLAYITHGEGGFYNRAKRLIATPHDGLNLMHEFTHALLGADQDALGMKVPTWIDEGMASLFETSTLIDGVPTPLPNFRLGDMLRFVNTSRYVPWKKLFSMPQGQFERQSGLLNYAESRYVLYYIWQQGKLKQWYDTYCDNYKTDKTGTLAIEKTFEKPLAKVEEDFKKWVPNAPRGIGRTPQGGPYLGISFESLGGLAGPRIAIITPNSAAERAGLKPGDVVNQMDGKKYPEMELLFRAIREKKVGDKVTLTVFRKNEILTVTVELAPRE